MATTKLEVKATIKITGDREELDYIRSLMRDLNVCSDSLAEWFKQALRPPESDPDLGSYDQLTFEAELWPVSSSDIKETD